ncbi:MAG: hypothetical protein M1837_000980 [Sclerophora amabilis]|nr:MAG: hypothetical protein M1837_000980 [Sclerophora amabilis]
MSHAFPRPSIPAFGGPPETLPDMRSSYEYVPSYDLTTNRPVGLDGHETIANHRPSVSSDLSQSSSRTSGDGQQLSLPHPQTGPPAPLHQQSRNASLELTSAPSGGSRNASSYPGTPLVNHHERSADTNIVQARRQLPSLSELLGPQSRSTSDGALFSPHWRATPSGDRASPGTSPFAGKPKYESFGPRISPSSDPSAYSLRSYSRAVEDERPFRQSSVSQPPTLTPSRPESAIQQSAAYREWEGVSQSGAPGVFAWSPQPVLQHDGRQPIATGPDSIPAPNQALLDVESTLPKEAIGPSIWTGTHFLPRFVGERDVPGEGPCFFYDDGSHCKTIIDGELVNAHWGVTKAGKPRKRLAVACLTCREKKIKCDPDYPKCVQCEKFGRICKFRNAPRGSRVSPEAWPYDQPESRPEFSAATSKSDNAGGELDDPPPRSGAFPYLEPESGVEDRKRKSFGSSDHLAVSANEVYPYESNSQYAERPVKRRRTSSATINRMAVGHSPTTGIVEQSTRPSFSTDLRTSNTPEYPLMERCETDPYDTDPGLVTDLFELYFEHINAAIYNIFPRQPFMRWLKTCKHKSQNDLMLVYTMLTVASNFSAVGERKTISREFARISRYAIDKHHDDFTLQLVQSRLLLALHYFASDRVTEAWDCSGAAFRAGSWLKLNLEDPHQHSLGANDYGLNFSGYAECRRRTFWAAYIMDRYNGLSAGHMSYFHDEDIFLRLPCDEASYEDQVEVRTPLFHEFKRSVSDSAQAADRSQLGSMAYLVHISSLVGDVLARIYRSSHLSHDRYEEEYEDFYRTAQHDLSRWKASLPKGLTASRDNLDDSVKSGLVGNFINMHTLYHATMMKLNRQARRKELKVESISRNIRQANKHASELLHVMRASTTRHDRIRDEKRDFSSPIAGYAVTLACDIVSAKGRLSEVSGTMTLLQDGLGILQELGFVWQSARTQRERVMRRLSELDHLALDHADDIRPLANSLTMQTRSPTYALNQPIIAASSVEEDLVYSASTDTYLAALAENDVVSNGAQP